ncbi:hypothetical protein LIP47_15250, partial [Eggerthella lenta]|nr:hypothetical protein [Eggerthella lenta]
MTCRTNEGRNKKPVSDMRESKKNACNDSAIIAGVLAFPVSWKILWSWFWYSILHKKYIIPKQNQLSRPLERKIMLPL